MHINKVAEDSDLIFNLLMQNHILDNMAMRCREMDTKLAELSVIHSLKLNNLIWTNPLIYNPIVADWSIANTIEFQEQLHIPITDNSIRDRLILENSLSIHTIIGNWKASLLHFAETIRETQLLNKELIETYRNS